MKKLFLVSLALLFSFAVFAKEDKGAAKAESDNAAAVMIAGTISDQNSGELLAGVEVHLEGTGQKTYTDFDGNFTFKVRPGEYTLVTSYISYEKKAEKLAVNQKDNNVQIHLKNSIAP